jgi:hypothetical protein
MCHRFLCHTHIGTRLEAEVRPMHLERVREGWAAIGEGWAVFAPTEDEAKERFAEAERKHREIDAREASRELEALPA